MNSQGKVQGHEVNFFNLLNGLLDAISYGSADEINSHVQSSLETICTVFEVDAVLLMKFDKGNGVHMQIYDSRSSTLHIEKCQNPGRLLSWIEKKMPDAQNITVSRLVELGDFDLDPQIFLDLKSGGVTLSEALIGRNQIIEGLLCLWSVKTEKSFSDEQRGQIKILGSVYRAALDRSTVENEREIKGHYYSSLTNFIQTALDSDDYLDTLYKFSQNLSELAQSDVSGFGLWDDEKQLVYPAGVYGASQEEVSSLHLEFGDTTLTELSQKCGDYLIIKDAPRSEFRDFKVIQSIPVSTILVIPMKSQKDMLGSAFIAYRQPRDLTEQEIFRCKRAVEQITLVLAKVQLLESRRRYIEKLNTISKFSNAMRNAQSLPEIPAMIMKKVIELCEVDDVALVFLDSAKGARELFQCGIDWEEIPQDEFFSRYSFIEKVIEGEGIKKLSTTEESVDHYEEKLNGNFLVAFPLIAHQQPLGAFCVMSQTPFTKNQINLLSSVANLVANAAFRQSLVDNLHIQLEDLRKTRLFLVQREKLAAIGELVAGVAHELNNPLTTIQLTSEDLYRQSLFELERRDLKKILTEAQRAAKIVHSLLDFSRQHVPERKTVSINDLLKSTLELVEFEFTKHEIQCIFHPDSKLPDTSADPYQIKQVFLNLINNAIQALERVDRPRILEISTQTSVSKYYGQVAHYEKFITIIFNDNGIGIPPSILPKIFDPFFTTKADGNGTGLGLSVCHGIITEHGGHIWAESGQEGGARFYIELPIRSFSREDDSDVQTMQNGLKKPYRLLIVEDEQNVLEILQRLLSRNGYDIDGAENGLDGLIYLENQRYDLIVCDISMPGMGGIQFYQEVTRRDPVLAKKIIFTTGDLINKENEEFFVQTGCVLLQKPFNMDTLLQNVSELLREGNKITEKLPES